MTNDIADRVYQHLKRFGPSYVPTIALRLGEAPHSVGTALTKNPYVFKPTGNVRHPGSKEWMII